MPGVRFPDGSLAWLGIRHGDLNVRQAARRLGGRPGRDRAGDEVCRLHNNVSHYAALSHPASALVHAPSPTHPPRLCLSSASGGWPKRSKTPETRAPYATNLRHVLNAIEGHFLTGFGDASEEPGKPIEPLPGAIEEAESYLRERSREATLTRFNRVEELMEGFETAYGLELLGSVHWVAKYEPSPATNPDEATVLIHAWNDRKRDSFPKQHIEVAWKRLFGMGWVK